MELKATLHTDGKGLWSSAKKNVKIFSIELHEWLDEKDVDYGKFGELRIFFDTKMWSIKEHGLIYTDEKFMKEFKEILMKNGFSKKAASDVDYSEQGMQSSDYVSCDCGGKFIKEFRKKNN